MKTRPKKSGRGGAEALPRLTPEKAAELKDLLSQVASGLASGREDLQQLLAATVGEAAWDLHLIAALGGLARAGAPELLAALFGDNPDKTRRKTLKKALHLLKTKGVPVPGDLLPREEAAGGRPAGRAPAKAYLSQVLGSGQRYVILEGPKEVLGGNFLVVQVSDRQGIQECVVMTLNSRQRQEFWDHLKELGLTDLATPPAAYAVRLIEEANRLQPDADAGSRYRSLKSRIWQEWGRPEEGQAEEELLPPLSPAEQSLLLEQSRNLVRDPLFFPWLPSPEEIAPWLEKMQEAQESRLVLSEPQKMARLDAVVDEAVLALYPQEDRELWRRRLLGMAYFLDLRGKSPEARLAQAAAQDLAATDRGPLAGENIFLKALVQAALQLAWEYAAKAGQAEKPASGLLAPPTESLIIRK